MRVLVTGATGFLGERLANTLVARGDTVLALARSDASAAKVKARGLTPVRGDLSNGASLRKALEGVEIDAVAHLAAEIATQRDKALLRQVNVEGTRALVDAVKGRALSKVVFASTVVTGDARGAVLTESTALPVETEYGRTKQEGEELLLAAFRSDQVPAVVVRPSHVYGPGGWFDEIRHDLRRGLFRIPGRGDNLWDVVHVDDAAKAFAVALDRGAPGETYHVVDDTPVSMNDFFAEVGKHEKRRVGHAPVWLARLLKGADPVRAATRSARSSNAKMRALGWSAAFPSYVEGLRAVYGATA